MKIIIIIIFLFIFVSLVNSSELKISDLCYPQQVYGLECHGIYSYNCANFLSTRTQYNCHVLSLFSGLKGVHRQNYKTFMYKIKDWAVLYFYSIPLKIFFFYNKQTDGQ